MGRDSINTLMVVLLVFDVILLAALLRGTKLASDARALLLFLLRMVK
mgnify:CR=1 FL=1